MTTQATSRVENKANTKITEDASPVQTLAESPIDTDPADVTEEDSDD